MPQTPIGPADVETWRRDGGLLVEGLIAPDAIAAARADFAAVYRMQPVAEAGIRHPASTKAEDGAFHTDQLQAIRSLPAFAAPALNLLALDPAVIAAVQALLGTPDVLLYTSYAWHKDAGGPDQNQPFHCDYPTHGLLVPPEDATLGAVNLFVYLTDVTRETGPLSYVPMSRTGEYDYHQAQPLPERQRALAEHERFVTCPAGSVFFYNTRVYHRGTSLTGAGAVRDVVGGGYRRLDSPWIGPRRGDFHPMLPQWRELFEAATAEQLAALGVPRPGAPYWTAATIGGVESRYPGWASDPWRAAAGLPRRADAPAAPAMQWPSVKDVSGVDLDAIRAEMLARAEAAAL